MKSRLHRNFVLWIVHHALEFKWFYLGAMICLYVLQVLQSVIPEKIRNLTLELGKGSIDHFSVWIFVGLAFGIFIFRTLSRLLFFYPARVQQKFLRMELLKKLEMVPPARYKEKNQGQIFQIIFDDINNLRAFIGFGLLQIGNLLIAFWVLVPKLNETDSYLWPAFSPLFLSVLFFTIMTFINQKYFKKMMDKKGEVQQYIIESYEAKQTIKNFHQEQNFINGFVKVSGEELLLFFKSSIGFAFTGPYVKLGLGASLIWASFLIRKQGGTPSDLVFFSGFLYLFLEPVMFMSWVAVVISQGIAAWRRVKELYFSLNKITKEELELQANHIRIESERLRLNAKYWNHEIRLEFPLRKWTVFIGETGCGKSTLLTKIATNLILNNKSVSMVQQEPYLFNDTVGENIFLGKRPTEKQYRLVSQLLKMFQLDGLAASIDEVLNLEVGENGKRLSGGQVKRIALIRSLMSGSEVLIWDDPFSSVDIILEKRIITQLREASDWTHLTFIISGHRLTTVRLSDEVIYLDNESGIKVSGSSEKILKEENVTRFFKEQMVELPLG